MGSNYGFTISEAEREALGGIATGAGCASIGALLRDIAAGRVKVRRVKETPLSASERVRRWLDGGGSYETAAIVAATGVSSVAASKAKKRWAEAGAAAAELCSMD